MSQSAPGYPERTPAGLPIRHGQSCAVHSLEANSTTIRERNQNAAVNLRGLLTLLGFTGSASLRDGTALARLTASETIPDVWRTVPPESKNPAPLTVNE